MQAERTKREKARKAATNTGKPLWDEDGARPVPSRAGDWPAFYRGFADAVRTGAPLPVRPEDAVHVLRVLEAAVRSSRERVIVPVRPS